MDSVALKQSDALLEILTYGKSNDKEQNNFRSAA